jgi:undecaprenyl-diphosphatase
MNVFEAIFLGLLQGLTEFLPVSSSGHLVLAQRIMGLRDDAVLFGVTVHLGTLAAVCFCYRRELSALVKKPFCPYTGMLIAATVPAVLAALLFKDFLERAFGGDYLGYGFIITAFILLSVTAFPRRMRRAASPPSSVREYAPRAVTFKTALIMGAAQGLAVLPGISRSGATIGGGLTAGADRAEAARFSFLMSIPIILAAAVSAVMDIGKTTVSIGALPLAAGFAAAALSGVLAVKLMTGIITSGKFLPFSVYLFILGTGVLLNQYVLGWF